MQIVTVGQKASDFARAWFEDNRYQDYLYLHGLSVEMAEAMAEYVHKRVRAELGFAGEDERDMEKMLSQGYRGSRYSFGYPACPRLEDQAPILSLLGAERIGVSLSEEFQLHPEQSTSAVVVTQSGREGTFRCSLAHAPRGGHDLALRHRYCATSWGVEANEGASSR